MNKLDFGLSLVLLSVTQLPVLAATDSASARRLMENYGRSAVVFEQNVGQAPQGMDFLGRGLFHALSLKATGATLTRTTDSQPGLTLTLLNSNGSQRVERHLCATWCSVLRTWVHASAHFLLLSLWVAD